MGQIVLRRIVAAVERPAFELDAGEEVVCIDHGRAAQGTDGWERRVGRREAASQLDGKLKLPVGHRHALHDVGEPGRGSLDPTTPDACGINVVGLAQKG